MSLIEIVIGDWGGDGHGRTETYTFRSNLPIGDVREAYFAAKAKLPRLCPERYCSDYQDSNVPDATWEALTATGCPLPERDDFCAEDMARIVAWFCMQGDPDLRLEEAEPTPTLAFYGHDAKGRHIGMIGYGLFE